MEDFYHSDFFERNYSLSNDFLIDSQSKSDPSIYVMVLSTFIVRSGIFLAQVSSIPSSNMQVLMLQNFLDISINTVMYCLLGNIFAFGDDVSSVIGTGNVLNEDSNMNDFARGWMIIIIASGLLTSAVADRISFFANLFLNAFVSGLTFPLIIHWVLSENGWMRVNTISGVKVSYKDYSYSGLIHMSGGFISLLALVVLNRRLLRFRDIDISSIPDNGLSLAMFAYLMTILGFIGISVPTYKYKTSHLGYDFYGIVLINSILSIFGSILIALSMSFIRPLEPIHKWRGLRYIQSGVSGIAVIAAGADVYYPLVSLGIGFVNGFIFSLVTYFIDNSSLEDYCNVVGVHFVSGLIGTFLPPGLGVREGFKSSAYYDFMHFLWQITCDVTILTSLAVVFVPIFLILDRLSVLRSYDEDVNHRRAKSVRKSNSVFYDSKPDMYLEPGFWKRIQPDGREDPQTEVIFQKDKVNEGSDNDVQYKNQYFVNYLFNTTPSIFFEDVPEKRSSSMFKVFPELSKNLKKMSLGSLNFSDSRLFQRFKEAIPIKQIGWRRGRTLPFRAASVLSFSQMETQV